MISASYETFFCGILAKIEVVMNKDKKVRLPSYEGLQRARKALKDMYKKKPSDALIDAINQIESESNEDAVLEKNQSKKKVASKLPEADV